jgi:hypothetical protein
MIQDLTSLSVLAPSAQQGFPLPKNEFIIARARAAIEELDPGGLFAAFGSGPGPPSSLLALSSFTTPNNRSARRRQRPANFRSCACAVGTARRLADSGPLAEKL